MSLLNEKEPYNEPCELTFFTRWFRARFILLVSTRKMKRYKTAMISGSSNAVYFFITYKISFVIEEKIMTVIEYA